MSDFPTLQQEIDRKSNVMLTELVQHLRKKTMSKEDIIFKAEVIWHCYSGLITNNDGFMEIVDEIKREANQL